LARIPIAVLLTLLLSPAAFPQSATASLEVTVESDAGTAGARVRLRAPGFAREAPTDERSRALFLGLRPGEYVFEAEGPGVHCPSQAIAIEPGAHVRTACTSGGREVAVVPPGVTSQDRATLFRRDGLLAIPRPSDPWSVLRDVPGVVVDRVNVGGSDTAQQSLLVSYGDPGTGAVWTLDGIDITDPAALGTTTVYPDMDALLGLEARTGAFDVRVRTPGVQVGLYLPAPGPRFVGAAHLRASADALQSDNLPAGLEGRPFFRNRTDRLLEMGAEAGGPLRSDRIWLWGSANRNAVRQQTFTEHEETLRTTTFQAKGRWRLGSGSLSFLALRAEKVDDDRDTSFSSAPEARWRQSGPGYVFSVEDARSLGAVSLVSRLGWVDAGFTLAPRGGTGASAFQDFRGVLRGSYYSLATERRRLQAGVEGATRRRLLGADHDLVAGLGYRWMPVSTHQFWPGSSTVGFEQQTVFFRVFRLTGFAVAYRDLFARSVADHAEAYLQDTARWGRVTLIAGLRLDRLAGHDRPSIVNANPTFPDLLPRVVYGGNERSIRWLDLLPRLGLAWDASGAGRLVARAGYAAYGAPLGSADVTFTNPVGRDFASVTYYWRDVDGDHLVEPAELDAVRGRVGFGGFDPAHPDSAISPNVIAPELRAPRTHELMASVESSRGRAFEARLDVSFRRLTHALWRPLRNLQESDYAIRGSVQGTLFGEDYDVGYFAPASTSKIVPGNGRILDNREGYAQDAFTVALAARGRWGGRLDWEAWGAWSDWYERFLDRSRAVQDPTPTDGEPLQDKGRLAARPGGLGRGDVFVNARWEAGAFVEGRLPWGLTAAAHAYARDGFPLPYFKVADTGDPTGGAKSVLVSPTFDRYRLPPVVLLDVRLGRAITLRRGTLRLDLDIFNVLNRGTTLQVARDVEQPAFARPREILRPRIVRLGLGYRF
jgi:hypothetical protein